MSNSLLTENASNELELIEFYIEEDLGNNESYRGYYGMNVAKVLEIIRQPDVTTMPSKHHPAALGTFNLRGRVLPLVDLSVWLNKNMVRNESLKVIVSEYSGVVTAFLVSGVTRIHRMSWKQVEAPSRHVQQYSNQSVTGVVRIEDRILFILDMETLISSLNPSMDMNRIASEAATKAPALPVNATKEQVEAAIARQEQENKLAVQDASQFHILVADDSHSILTIIVNTLQHAGYQVSKASSGREAWDMLCKCRNEAEAEHLPIHSKIDVVITDIEMPEMDGHALTRKIKEDNVLKQVPVVLFSSLITDAMRVKGQRVGADDQISKPDLPFLTKRLRSIIAEKHGK